MREGADIDECDDNEVCQIVARIFLPIDDPEYPGEIRLDDAGNPTCTAFVLAGHPIPEPRCDHTEDLFGATA